MSKYYVSCNLRHLHHPEFTQLLAQLLEDFKASNLKSKDEDFTRLLNVIKTKLPTMQAALGQVRASEKSKIIQELDTARDHAFKALLDSIKPYRYASTSTEQQAYTTLSLLFKHYKGAERATLSEETALINALVTKLKSEEYQDDVTTLGITKFVTALAAAETAFETQFNARSKESLNKVTYDVKKLRTELTKDYVAFIDYVGVLAQYKNDPFYKNVLNVINNGRKYFSEITTRRHSKEQEKNTAPKVNPIDSTANAL